MAIKYRIGKKNFLQKSEINKEQFEHEKYFDTKIIKVLKIPLLYTKLSNIHRVCGHGIAQNDAVLNNKYTIYRYKKK